MWSRINGQVSIGAISISPDGIGDTDRPDGHYIHQKNIFTPTSILIRSFQTNLRFSHRLCFRTATSCAIENITWLPFPGHDSVRRKIHPFKIQRSEEHTSELQSRGHLVCRLLL